MYNTKAYSAASAPRRWPPPRSAARPDRPRRADRHTLLRICHSDLHYSRDEWHNSMPTLPLRAGHESLAGSPSRVGVSKFRRGRRRSAAGRLRPHLPQLPGGTRAVLPEPGPPTGRQTSTRRPRSPTRLLTHRRGRAIRPRIRPTSTSPGPRRCSAPASRRNSPMRHWGVAKARKSASSASAGSAHGREVRARVRGAHRRLHHVAEQAGGRRARLGADEVVVSKTPTR